MLYHSEGIIRYSTNPYKVILEIDQSIADYYMSLVPRWRAKLTRQRYAAHISIVRKQIPTKLDAWGKYDGMTTEFSYENEVHNCPVYFWIHAFTTLGERIREEVGLPVYLSDKAPYPFKQRFHVTIGNLIGEKEHESQTNFESSSCPTVRWPISRESSSTKPIRDIRADDEVSGSYSGY